MTASDDDEVLREFLLESSENLTQLDRDFVALEQDPRDHERLSAIFRCVHTIKVTAGFLGFPQLEALTHRGESLLARMRDGKIVLDGAMTSALLAMVDAVRKVLASVEAGAGEGNDDHTELVRELARVGVGGEATEPVAAAALARPAVAAPTAPAVSASPAAAPRSPPVAVAVAIPGDGAPRAPSVADSTVRVDVVLLDRVMNLVGELVLARNQIIQFGATAKDPAFAKAAQRLNLLTTELQEGVMKTRMQPIENVWGKFPRLVRDLSRACGKLVELEFDGASTELDRTIIEAIRDPLTHAVRNAVDHGIETPEKRRLATSSPR